MLRIVFVLWDGLRPEFVRADLTPSLCALSGRGVAFDRHTAAFPTETRVNSSTIATGCHPSAHGITGNSVYVPETGATGSLNTGDHEALEAISRARGRVLACPTLAARLRAAGLTTLAVGGGSPGSTLLQDPEADGRVINTRGVTQPADEKARLEGIYGPFPAKPDADAWNDFALRLFIQEGVRSGVDYGVLWLCDPDYTQHKVGLGAPEALDAIKRNDGRLAELLRELGPDTCVMVASDHGFSTLRGPNRRGELLAEARIPAASAVSVSCGYHLADPEDAPALVETMRGKDWIGPVFSKRPCEGAFSLADAFLDHPGAPDVMFSRAWNREENAHGVAGTSLGSDGIASHGTCSPYDLRCVLIGAGPGFRTGHRSDVPSGAADIAPTIMDLLGCPDRGNFDGRSLVGDLRSEQAPEVTLDERTAGDSVLRYATVHGRRYLLEGA